MLISIGTLVCFVMCGKISHSESTSRATRTFSALAVTTVSRGVRNSLHLAKLQSSFGDKHIIVVLRKGNFVWEVPIWLVSRPAREIVSCCCWMPMWWFAVNSVVTRSARQKRTLHIIEHATCNPSIVSHNITTNNRLPNTLLVHTTLQHYTTH